MTTTPANPVAARVVRPMGEHVLGLSGPRLSQFGFSLTDQVLSVGGMFVANVALARTVSKEEYGMFALSYSVFTFLSGLHNAAILETYTVYGAGRYHERNREYSWLIWRSNAMLCVALTLLLLLAWRILALTSPAHASRSLLGLAISAGVILSAALLRRMLYVKRAPRIAARFSLVFFISVLAMLAVAIRAGILNGLTVFLIVAAGWILGGIFVARELPVLTSLHSFHEAQPDHWKEHWKYARWVLATAFVFQFTTQGYYWLVAGFLGLKEVAQLRVIYLLVTPIDQVLVATTLLVLPIMSFHFASHRMDRLLVFWKKYLAATLTITGLFAIIVCLLGHRVLNLVYGGKFDEVAGLLSFLAFLPVVLGVGNTMNAALKAAEKPQFVLYAYLCGGLATLLGGLPLVAILGLRGAVSGMILSGAAYTTALCIGFRSVAKAPFHSALMSADTASLGDD
jgi:O-antigen/teichoic acid export membrane protein